MKNFLVMIVTLTILQSSAVMAQDVEIQDAPPIPNREAARERFANMSEEEREQRRSERRGDMSEEDREQRRSERMGNRSEEDRAGTSERGQGRSGGKRGQDRRDG